MRLYKQKGSKFWSFTLYENGNRVRKSTRTTKKREATEIATRYAQSVFDRELHGVLPKITIHDAIKKFLNEQQYKSLATYKSSKSYCNTICKNMSCTEYLSDVTSADLLAFRDEVKHLSNSSINHLTTTLMTLRNRCEDWGYQIPTYKIKKLKEHHKLRYLMEGEEEALMKHLTDQDARDIVTILVDTGMRYGELMSLTWSSIENHKTINVFRTKVNNEGIITATDRVRRVLIRRSDTNSIYIFSHRDDPSKPRPHSTKAIMRAVEKAGLNSKANVTRYGKFTVHSLRDTFATRLVKAGCSLYDVQIMLGHSSPQMTQKYAHLASSDISERIATILNRT